MTRRTPIIEKVYNILVVDGAEKTPTQLAKAKISTTKAKIESLYASIDVSDQPPFEAMARLGLQMVQVPLP
jgi:hypothetical protein